MLATKLCVYPVEAEFQIFSWGPSHTYSETKKLAKELGFTIVKEPNDFLQKKIHTNHLKEVYSICNGNPSHVTDYLECGEYERLAKDVDDEYEESQTSLMQGYLGLESSDPINEVS